MALSNRFAVAGHRLPRLDAPAKVTGTQIYGTDVMLPGMLFGRLFRSPVPHALIRRLNIAQAAAIPGVRAVITTTDIPDTRYGPAVRDMPALATDRVRYIGEPIAAVAATSLEIAERAVAAIEAEFEPLPAQFDPEAALAPDAALLHPDWARYQALPILARNGNVASHSRIHHGDVEAAFAQCFRVYENRFTTPVVHAGYTEPRAATARWEGDGSLTVWSNGQLPYEVQASLADILELPVSRIRVLVPGIGGGFGGKLRIALEHYAALLARAAGWPVKLVSTCEEEFTAAHPRQASIITLRTGVSRDGLLLAKQARVVMDCGAYAGSGAGTAAVALQIVAGPYRTPNLLLDGFAVYTNKLPTGSFRATAGPMGNFAVEIPDGHHRRRSRDRSVGIASAQRGARRRQRSGRREAARGQRRGVSAQGGTRDWLARSASQPRARQGYCLRLVDDDRRIIRGLCEAARGRHGDAEQWRGGTGDRGVEWGLPGFGGGTWPAARRHPRGGGGYRRRALRLWRAGQPHRVFGRQCRARGGGDFAATHCCVCRRTVRRCGGTRDARGWLRRCRY